MKKIFFIIGSSGAGKTTVVEGLEREKLPGFRFVYADKIGVPTEEEKKTQRSQEEWQKRKTLERIVDVQKSTPDDISVIFDSQTRPSFIEESCATLGIKDYLTILIDCSDEERRRRLTDRKQPELAHADMMNWAKYLREEVGKRNGIIIDNTDLRPEETLATLKKILV
jgi:dephospho-CoA kinase